jgi:hypothetical protein
MMRKLLSVNLHFIYIVFFYILHRVNEYYGLLPAGSSLYYLVIFLAVSLGLLLMSFLFLPSYLKSCLYSTLLMLVVLFFGALHDGIRMLPLPALFSSYKFILAALIFICITLFVIIKRSKNNFKRINYYFNTLFLLLLVFELLTSLYHIINGTKEKNNLADTSLSMVKKYKPCDTCAKPDIYFIIFDSYTSSSCLKKEFGFDNSGLDSLLKSAGFYIAANSRSNYASTPMTVASCFNMNYFPATVNNKEFSGKLILQAVESVYRSELAALLEKEGYEIRNHSVFHLKNHPSGQQIMRSYYPKKVFYDNTLPGRFQQDVLWNFLPSGKISPAKNYYDEPRHANYLNNISSTIKSLKDEIRNTSGRPKFVYAHIMLPHYPYYFDEAGNYNPFSDIYKIDQSLYLKQLIYSNRIISDVISSLKQHQKNRIVVIGGDHGYREFAERSKLPEIFPIYHAYYFPDAGYSKLYDSISPVNTFRIIFNQYFKQDFPLLPDSSVYIKDPSLNFEINKNKQTHDKEQLDH